MDYNIRYLWTYQCVQQNLLKNDLYYIPFQNTQILLVESVSHVSQYEAILTCKSDIDSTRENDVKIT